MALASHCQATRAAKLSPNGFASHSRVRNTNLGTQTCDGWPEGLAGRRKLDRRKLQKSLITETETESNEADRMKILLLGHDS